MPRTYISIYTCRDVCIPMNDPIRLVINKRCFFFENLVAYGKRSCLMGLDSRDDRERAGL